MFHETDNDLFSLLQLAQRDQKIKDNGNKIETEVFLIPILSIIAFCFGNDKILLT
jgi:hypothetical protein